MSSQKQQYIVFKHVPCLLFTCHDVKLQKQCCPTLPKTKSVQCLVFVYPDITAKLVLPSPILPKSVQCLVFVYPDTITAKAVPTSLTLPKVCNV